jgi:predicted signal transduction protein with EAL and GGDEF domain
MQNFEVCIKTSDGETRYLLLNYFLLETDDRVLLTGVNITEQRRMMNQLHRIAYYDQLTGHPSQTMFRNLVDQELNMIAASGKHAPFLYIGSAI